MEKLIQKALLPLFTISKVEAICGYFIFDLNNDTAELINCLLSICRYKIWLIRNTIKYDEKQIDFTECYLGLRHYIADHMQILIESKSTKKEVKQKVSKVLIELPTIFCSGIDENDVGTR